MTMKIDDTLKFKLQLVWKGALIGVLVGLLVSSYRFTLEYLDTLRNQWLDKPIGWFSLCSIVGLIGLAWIVSRLLKWAPFSNGSGIPQIRAELDGEIHVQPLPTLVSKFVGGAINNFVGLSLGREGPSIQLGGTLTKAVASKLNVKSEEETNYLMTAGASAGLSAAFNAPLAATLFALEELHGSFSPFLLITSLIACLTANLTSFYFLGQESSFSFGLNSQVPYQQWPWLLLAGIICGLIGSLYNVTLQTLKKCFNQIKLPKFYIIAILFIFTFIMGHSSRLLLGGGHSIVEMLVETPLSITILLFLVFGKLIFTAISFDSGVQGGIFLPVLVIGAATGSLIYQIITPFAHLDGLMLHFIVVCMAGVLTAVVRSPITAILLVMEMTASNSNMLMISSCVFTAYLTAELLKVKPVYEQLYENLLDSLNPLTHNKKNQ